ncbi:MAG TPA: sigma-70 family RNA polymerase sigma factor [Actinopolymorphaceae bacterium]
MPGHLPDAEAVLSEAALETWFAEHRRELAGYCYRMLGSAFEAEDAVQETMIRAWKHLDRYDPGRATLRTWVYAIATNICFDLLRAGQRRARPVDLSAPSAPGAPIGPPLPETALLTPVPDHVVVPDGDPAEVAARRETVRLAFVAALQHLPPRQRAVLILRDVLRWSAAETAGLLETSTASVNSALQRARATLDSVRPAATDPFRPLDRAQHDLLTRYIAAFEGHDIDALVALLHEDATMSMPPFSWYVRGRHHIGEAMRGPDSACHGSRFVPVAANGTAAFGQYVPDPTREDGYRPWALLVLDIAQGAISAMTTFLDADRLFPLFQLPTRPGRFGSPRER